MQDDEFPFSHNRSGLIFESRRKALNEIEQTVTTGSNVCTVLNVAGRPESFRCRVIALVEECVERFQDESLVLFWCSFWHPDFLPPFELLRRSLRLHRLVGNKT